MRIDRAYKDLILRNNNLENINAKLHLVTKTHLLLPPRSNILTRKPLYLVDSFENPTVGATRSRDSPTNDFAVHVFPVLSRPSIRMLIFRSKTFTEFLPINWLQHIVPSVIICIILRIFLRMHYNFDKC